MNIGGVMAAHSHFGLRFPHYEEIMQPVSEEELKCFKNDVKRGESFISMFNYALSLGTFSRAGCHVGE